MRALLALALALAACMEGHGGHGGGSYGGHSSGGGGGGGEAREAHVSHSSSSSAGPTLEHVARAVLPVAATVAEALTAGAVEETPDPAPGAPASEMSGPLIDNGDPCNRCPEDFACDQCAGIDGAACTYAPPGAYSRCATPW
jgi:hypothetical protein